MRGKKLLHFILVLFLFTTLLSSFEVVQTYAAASDAKRSELKSYIENVAGSAAYRFSARDSAGNDMGCGKIIANPYVSGQFLAVYFTYDSAGVGRVHLGRSTDLMNWTFVTTLGGSSGANATQPAIAAASDGGFVVAWEQEPNNHIRVLYYSSWANLQSNTVSKSYDCPRQLSSYAEGTPNIYSASSTKVDIGFHYFKNGDVDRQARGTLTNFNSWSSSVQTNYDNAILYHGVKGNIGDRDCLNYFGYDFGIIEGQYTKGDFGSWRCFIYDYQTGNAEQLNIRTPGGTQAFANPSFTSLQINGRWAVVVTMYLFNAAPGEGGELIYYMYTDGGSQGNSNPFDSNATYKIVNRNSGKVADVNGASLSDGTPVIQWGYGGNSNQQWQIVPVCTGIYKVLNRNSGKAMDVSGSSTADGGLIIQWTFGGGFNQQWEIVDVGGGYYTFINRNSRKALDVSGASVDNGAQLIQSGYSGSYSQQWQIIKVQ